jgi:hypothetical protein
MDRDQYNEHQPVPLTSELNTFGVFGDSAKWLPSLERSHFPASDYLHDRLRPYFSLLIPNDEAFTRTFDRFEYFLSLMYGLYRLKDRIRFWTPVGSFAWRGRPEIIKEIQSEIEQKKEHWPPVKARLFGVPLERLIEVKCLLRPIFSECGIVRGFGFAR